MLAPSVMKLRPSPPPVGPIQMPFRESNAMTLPSGDHEVLDGTPLPSGRRISMSASQH